MVSLTGYATSFFFECRISETKKLYKSGADYVITPKILAGEKIAKIIHSKDYDLKGAKKRHLKRIGDIHKVLY